MIQIPIEYTQDDEGVGYHRVPEELKDQDPFGLTVIAGHTTQIAGSKEPSIRYFNFYSIAHNIGDDTGYFILEGEKTRPFKPGQMAVITPGSKNDYGVRSGKFIESFLVFSGSLADHLRDNGIIKDGLFDMGDKPLLNPIIRGYADLSYPARLKAKIELLNLIHEIYMCDIRKNVKSNTRMEELIDKMASNLHLPWGIREMSGFCGMSEPHFRRMFKRFTGCSPRDYVERMKMNRACELLRYTDTSIDGVAASLGYHDPFHFNRRFKASVGMPPGAYRKTYKK